MSGSVTRRFQAVCDRRMHSRRAAGRGPTRKIIERQRVQQAAADTAKKLEDATKEAEETARVAAAQAAHEEAQVSLSGQKKVYYNKMVSRHRPVEILVGPVETEFQGRLGFR